MFVLPTAAPKRCQRQAQNDHSAACCLRLPHFCLCLLGVLLALCLTRNRAWAGIDVPGGYEIPFAYDALRAPWIVIQVSVNGKAPLAFAVDTGSQLPLLLDTSVVTTLGLKLDTKSVRVHDKPFASAPIRSLVLIGKDKANSPDVKDVATAYVGDLNLFRQFTATRDIAGVIGIPVLAQTAARLDFKSKTLTLWTEQNDQNDLKAALQRAGAAFVNLKQHSKDNMYYVEVSPGMRLSTDLLLDTGASQTALPMNFAPKLKPLGTRPSLSANLSTLYITPDMLLPSLKIGDLEEPRVEVASEPPSGDLTLGMELLSRFRITWLFPEKLMLLERPEDYAERIRTSGWVGVELDKKDKAYVVSDVIAGSPGQQAGIAKGDRIEAVNDNSCGGLKLYEVEALLNGFAGTKISVRLVQADGTSAVATLTPVSRYRAPLMAISGLILVREANTSLKVAGLTPGCPGERAGIKANDTVLMWNGKPTATMTPSTLFLEGRKTESLLTIQRPGSDKPLELHLSVK